MHTVSQTFILKLTPQVKLHFFIILFFLYWNCCLFFSNINIFLQMTRHRQRVDEFISPITNRRHFCLSWKLRHSARKILKRHCCFLNSDFLFQIAWLFEKKLYNMTINVSHIVSMFFFYWLKHTSFDCLWGQGLRATNSHMVLCM